MAYDLPFEKPLAELDDKINKLKRKGENLKLKEQKRLQYQEEQLQERTREIYSQLNAWQTVLVSRHKNRPHAVDYLKYMCDDFFELHGDRKYGDNATIIGGPATLDGRTVMFIGQEKGRDIKDQALRNAGQPHPEGYRKAARLMKQAAKFSFPVICLIDTPGASIALDDEKLGQSTAIAENLYLMAGLRTPIIGAIIGEGGSGGALALAVVDRILMLEHSYYTVASPESAAVIRWRDIKYAPEAAETMHVSARQLEKHSQLIDEIVSEPPGGAHRDYQAAACSLKEALIRHLNDLTQLSIETLLEQRYQKYRAIGKFAFAEQQA
jgi:acetyl-CoA carboxylase carboxyl transferase subunit alpha